MPRRGVDSVSKREVSVTSEGLESFLFELEALYLNCRDIAGFITKDIASIRINYLLSKAIYQQLIALEEKINLKGLSKEQQLQVKMKMAEIKHIYCISALYAGQSAHEANIAIYQVSEGSEEKEQIFHLPLAPSGGVLITESEVLEIVTQNVAADDSDIKYYKAPAVYWMEVSEDAEDLKKAERYLRKLLDSPSKCVKIFSEKFLLKSALSGKITLPFHELTALRRHLEPTDFNAQVAYINCLFQMEIEDNYQEIMAVCQYLLKKPIGDDLKRKVYAYLGVANGAKKPPNRKKSRTYYEKSLELGFNARVVFCLACLLDTEHASSEDKLEAIRLYKTAAIEGDLRALNSLGQVYFEGDGVDQDREKAFQCWWRAVEVLEVIDDRFMAGQIYNKLALYYYSRNDFKEAERYCLLSLDCGEEKSNCYLAAIYHDTGRYKESRDLFLKLLSKSKKNTELMYNISATYLREFAETREISLLNEAEKFLIKAAKKRCYRAIMQLIWLFFFVSSVGGLDSFTTTREELLLFVQNFIDKSDEDPEVELLDAFDRLKADDFSKKAPEESSLSLESPSSVDDKLYDIYHKNQPAKKSINDFLIFLKQAVLTHRESAVFVRLLGKLFPKCARVDIDLVKESLLAVDSLIQAHVNQFSSRDCCEVLSGLSQWMVCPDDPLLAPILDRLGRLLIDNKKFISESTVLEWAHIVIYSAKLLPFQHEVLSDALKCALDQVIIRIDALRGYCAHLLLQHLAIIHNANERLFDLESIKPLIEYAKSTVVGLSDEKSMMQLLLALSYFKSLPGNPFNIEDELINQLKQMRSQRPDIPTESKFQHMLTEDVKSLVRGKVSTEVMIDGLLPVDIVFGETIVQINGPTHHHAQDISSKVHYHATASDTLKTRLLKMAGYRVIALPFYSVPTDSAARKNWVRRQLFQPTQEKIASNPAIFMPGNKGKREVGGNVPLVNHLTR